MNEPNSSDLDLLHTALLQWSTVEQMQALAHRLLPPKDVADLEATMSKCAERTREVLKSTKDGRTPTGIDSIQTEEELKVVLSRLELLADQNPQAAK